MTVVEAYAGKKNINPPDESSQLYPVVSSLPIEGIAQNTTGNVFVPKMVKIGSVEGRDGGATTTTTVGIALSQAGNSVEGQDASSSGHNGGGGAGSGSNGSDQSTGSVGTNTNSGVSGGHKHEEYNKDKGNDVERPNVGVGRSGTNIVGNSSNMTLVATFIAIVLQSTSAIFALGFGELSPLGQKLFTGVLVINLAGFLCLYVALFPSLYISSRAKEILVRVGGAAAAFGFLLMVGIKLPLWITISACLVVLAASLLSFMSKTGL